ncbi:MAG: tripartite tricarboxylate transporter permease [Deinococcota bacterium]
MNLATWQSLLALVLGSCYGALFGAIPGLTATLAVALFIPIAFFLDPVLALPAIIGISSTAIFAGDVGSIVAKIPGTPASAAYVEELNSLGKRQGAIYALGISAMGSAVGGIIGTGLLIVSATFLARVAKNFSSFEYFWIAVLGLTAGIFAAGRSPLKGFVSLLLGLAFATVGIDPTLGYPRFDFGNPNLLGGLNYIVVMIGLFGFSEVLGHLVAGRRQAQPSEVGKVVSSRQAFFIDPSKLMLKHPLLVLRSSLMGTFVGFLPGAGADIGAWVASSVEKMSVLRQHNKQPTTSPADVASPVEEDAITEAHHDTIVLAGTSSNNAAVASAWIPALALGLPGDTVTAIVLGVFLMKGITPGPQLFQNDLPLVWTLYGAFIVCNLLLLPFLGYITAGAVAKIVRIPFNILLSIITVLCVVGAFAINNNPFDVWVMAGMGVVALLLKVGGFPLAQVVLGMVLGPILEQNFMVSAIKSRWDLSSFFERPIAIVLMLVTIGIVIIGLRLRAHHPEPA